MKQLYIVFQKIMPRHLLLVKILLVKVFILLGAITLQAQTATPPAGLGTSTDPYEIASLENLYWIAAPDSEVSNPDRAARWSSHYIQTANIDASATGEGGDWGIGGWTPIGVNVISSFKGSYDGQGYTINGLFIDREVTNYTGLFGVLDGAKVSNLGITGVDVTGVRQVGGLAGYIFGGSEISNCYVTGSVNGERWIGGLVGNNSGSVIEKSYSEVNVSGTDARIGGLVGTSVSGSEILLSYSSGSVSGDDNYNGGLVGYISTNSKIENCYSRASVTTGSHVGGLAGRLFNGVVVINSYSTGEVQGSDFVGGLIGSTGGDPSFITESFWDTETSGQNESAGGEGKTTLEMKVFSTFIDAGWDFLCETDNGTYDFWGKNPAGNDGYPFLIWQGIDHIIVGDASEDQTVCGDIPDDLILHDYLGNIQWEVSNDNISFNDIEDAINDMLPGSSIGYQGGIRYFRARVTGVGDDCEQFSNVVTVTMFDPQEPEGDGTPEDPYEIALYENLVWLAQQPGEWDNHFKQTTNIEVHYICQDEVNGWSPIGNSTNPFTGSYDGQGHTINGLFIDRSGTDFIGLFGVIQGVKVSNLGVTGVDITGKQQVGGLAGRISEGSELSNCYVTGSVKGSSWIGGLVGSNFASVIEKSHSEVNVSGTGARIGGLVGTSDNGSEILLSYSAGNVSGGGLYLGGLVGYIRNNSRVENCYSRASVLTTGSHVGGLVGRMFDKNDVINSYSTGKVQGSNALGGLIGSTGGDPSVVTESFWNTETSGLTGSAGGEGKTTSEMKAQNTFEDADWNFEGIWAIDPTINDGYPYLNWIVIIWSGSENDNWHNPENWDKKLVPVAQDYIIIAPSDNDPVIKDRNVTVRYLIINSNAGLEVDLSRSLTIRTNGRLTMRPASSLTAGGAIINDSGSSGLIIESDENNTGSLILNNPGVNATVERWITGAQWHIVSPPVSGQDIQGFISNSTIAYNSANNYYALTHYDESRYGGSGGWAPYYTGSTGGDLGLGTGYLAGRTSDGKLMFSGGLAHSDVNITIGREAYGWNAIGNPYASAIGVRNGAGSTHNFLDLNKDELDEGFEALYIYDPDAPGYRIINNVTTKSNINQDYIQPGQGFIVKSKDGGGDISFTQSMRYHDSSSEFFKKSAESPWPFIQLQVSSNDREVSTLIAFNYNMTRGLDPTYDAGQFGADAGFNLYTRLVEDDKGVKFAIQALPDYGFEDMVIPVGFDFSEGGEVTFSAADLDLPASASAILEDRELDVFTDLEKESYTVSLDADTEGPGRFFLHTDIQITSVEDIIDEAGREKIQIYSYGKEVFIVGEVRDNSVATLYDLTGRQVITQRLINSERNSFRVDELERGIYLIRVSGDGINKTGRVFIE